MYIFMVKYILLNEEGDVMKIIAIIICSFFITGIVLGARTFTKEAEKEVPEEESVIQGNATIEEDQGLEEITEEIPNEQTQEEKIQEEPTEETEEESEKIEEEKEKPKEDLIIKPQITGSGEYKTF